MKNIILVFFFLLIGFKTTAHDFARLEEYKVVLEILKQAKTQRNP